MFCGKLDGLAFLPVDKVRDGQGLPTHVYCMPDGIPTIARISQTAKASSISLIIFMPQTCRDWFAVSNIQYGSSGVVTCLRPRRLPPCFHRRSGNSTRYHCITVRWPAGQKRVRVMEQRGGN